MKKLLSLITLLIASAYLLTSCNDDHDHDHGDHSHEDGDHDHKDDDHDDEKGDHKHGDDSHTHGPGIEAGPNGGRIFNKVEPHFEFFVMADRKVQITFLKEDNKTAIAPGGQSISVMGGDRSNPTKMKFQKSGNVLVSDVAFPAGNDFPVVVQIKQDADSKAVIEKLNLNLEQCPTCQNKEYACTCDH